ncbi:uncharacterized protein IL334_001654 [Kwoniella shivajii]|uniref:Ataxin-2 C-terminal domain-containing protein n=1 Tax=Kwoniella shivajii TaxID=564305 RepID=A0ABZ1CSI6_9TREE|nr:hypothetical protein IL334_001654 [Kwoniella shivajii]
MSTANLSSADISTSCMSSNTQSMFSRPSILSEKTVDRNASQGARERETRIESYPDEDEASWDPWDPWDEDEEIRQFNDRIADDLANNEPYEPKTPPFTLANAVQKQKPSTMKSWKDNHHPSLPLIDEDESGVAQNEND